MFSRILIVFAILWWREALLNRLTTQYFCGVLGVIPSAEEAIVPWLFGKFTICSVLSTREKIVRHWSDNKWASHYFPFSLSFWESKADVISTYAVGSSDINRMTYLPKVILIIRVEQPYTIPLQFSAQRFTIQTHWVVHIELYPSVKSYTHNGKWSCIKLSLVVLVLFERETVFEWDYLEPQKQRNLSLCQRFSTSNDFALQESLAICGSIWCCQSSGVDVGVCACASVLLASSG